MGPPRLAVESGFTPVGYYGSAILSELMIQTLTPEPTGVKPGVLRVD
jgi:hypothetical protein